MRLCSDIKVVFVSTPKCATHTLFDVMEKHFGGVRIGKIHTRPPATRYRDHFIFTVVRNPYDRAVSSWTWAQNCEHPDRVRQDVGGPDFPSFAKGLSRGRHAWMPCINQTTWQSAFNPTAVIHIENLQDEFNALPFVTEPIELPCLNKWEHPPWRELMTEEIAGWIRQWAGPDFENFGYNPDDWGQE